jgi:hypothetical protein
MQCGQGFYTRLVCGLAVVEAGISATPIRLHSRVSIYRKTHHTSTLLLSIGLVYY